MIKNKKDLLFYLNADLGIKNCNYIYYFTKCIGLWIRGSEMLPIWRFIYSLRLYEFYYNQNKLSLFNTIIKQYWRFVFRHNQLKYNLYIEPNTIKNGLKIVHPGFRKIPDFVEIGMNCTILPMVLLGKKRPGIKGKIIIGNNCYISTGVTILSPVKIGDNVTIGAGAVVTKDVESGSVIVGMPAKRINF